MDTNICDKSATALEVEMSEAMTQETNEQKSAQTGDQTSQQDFVSTNTQYLLQLTIGPVQEFIKQARRSRDLYAGSLMLSHLSFFAAEMVLERAKALKAEAELIFPNWDGKDDAEREELRNVARDNCANKILALVSLPSSHTEEQIKKAMDEIIDAVRLELRLRMAVPGEADELSKARNACYAKANGSDPQEDRSDQWIVRVLEQSKEYILPVGLETWGKPVEAKETSQEEERSAERVYREMIREQAENLIEFYAGWVQCSAADYSKIAKELSDAVDGRKRLRNFKQLSWQINGMPKSSLDGFRNNILVDVDLTRTALEKRAGLSIRDQEKLDVISLLKRQYADAATPEMLLEDQNPEEREYAYNYICNRPIQRNFASLTNVAAVKWLRDVFSNISQEGALLGLERIVEKSRELNKIFHFKSVRFDDEDIFRNYDISKLFSTKRGENRNFLKYFHPHDAAIFIPERLQATAKEYTALLGQSDINRLQEIAGLVSKIYQKHIDHLRADAESGPNGSREPPRYLACIYADGDRMGELLEALAQPSMHKRVARDLVRFAQFATQIVEESYDGALVYAGGDDVLAFVCLDDAFDCAYKLQDAFKKCVDTSKYGIRGLPQPTLSVGIGIGHVMDGIAHLRSLGEKAEKLAKGSDLADLDKQRNGLGIIFDKRSGDAIEYRCQWDSREFHQLRTAFALMLTQDFPAKKVYEIEKEAGFLIKLEKDARKAEGTPESDKNSQENFLRKAFAIAAIVRQSDWIGGFVGQYKGNYNKSEWQKWAPEAKEAITEWLLWEIFGCHIGTMLPNTTTSKELGAVWSKNPVLEKILQLKIFAERMPDEYTTSPPQDVDWQKLFEENVIGWVNRMLIAVAYRQNAYFKEKNILLDLGQAL